MYSFRITTNGTMRNYRSKLMNSRKSLNDSMEKVMTGRNFTSGAEDPTAASRSFFLRRQMCRTDDQILNTSSVASKFQTAWTALDPIVDGDVEHPGLDGLADLLQGVNGATGAGRRPLGQSLLSKADSIVQGMNARYGDAFIFAGADGLNTPFSLSEGGKLLYRGVPVDTPTPDMLEKDFEHDAGGNLTAKGAADFDSYKSEFYRKTGFDYDTALRDSAKLKSMADETTYVDIGLGFQEESQGVMLESSAYNSALSGLNFLGFGQDKDGDSKNLVSLLRELGAIFSSCDPDTGNYINPNMADRANELIDKLQGAISYTSERHVRLTAQVTFLNNNTEQLKSAADSMQTQRYELEDVDPAYAITQMAWAQYSYNSALRIGNDILSQSLLDYMR